MRRRTVNNQLLHKMEIASHDKCLFCNGHIETIEHIHLQCKNAKRIWNDTQKWIREIYNSHFQISDIEKLFGCMENNQITT